MPMVPTIRLTVPTFNSATTLDDTLLSLRRQRRRALEVVVVDSGSTDGTLEICERWGVRVRYFPPGNMYAAINAGLKDSGTTWVGYINSDDLLYPESCERMTRLGERTRADIIYGSVDRLDPGGRYLYSFDPAEPHQLLAIMRRGMSGGIYQQASLYRTEVFKSLGGFSETYKYCADLDFFARAVAGSLRFARVKRPPLAALRLSRSQLSRTHWEEMEAEHRDIAQRLRSGKTWRDGLTDAAWQLANTGNYLGRWLRYYQLSGKFCFTRSMALCEERDESSNL
jgi:glycosyltransferase involved in cell wall biosynthesis